MDWKEFLECLQALLMHLHLKNKYFVWVICANLFKIIVKFIDTFVLENNDILSVKYFSV